MQTKLERLKRGFAGHDLTCEKDMKLLNMAIILGKWGILGVITFMLSMWEIKDITFSLFIFTYLSLFIQLSALGIYEGNSEMSVKTALNKIDLFSSIAVLVVSIVFYLLFFGTFPLSSVLISLGVFIYTKNKTRG